MANSWFRCKQFLIKQDKCSHKVGTDSFLLGSWVNVNNVNKVLDIGTGTGILSLMIAQRTEHTTITAIEIDTQSYEQAKENVYNSPWKERIKVINISLQQFDEKELFDLIICNPPYFNNSLKSPNLKRNIARHSISLSLNDIIEYAKSHLCRNGKLALILPVTEMEILNHLITKNNLHIIRLAKVYPNYNKPAHRILIECAQYFENYVPEEIVIEANKRHVYTKKFAELTNEFYLNLKVERQ